VKIRVSPQRADALVQRHTHDPAAYDFYLRGRHASMQLTPAGNRAAMEHYERAIERDTNYALAWAGVAFVLSASPINSDIEPATVASRARAAAQRALASAPSLSEALFASGYVSFWLERDWRAAERSLRQAIELDPNNAMSHLVLAHVLSQKGEQLEARTLGRRARELEPMFPVTYALSSQVAFQARDYASAVEHARQAIAIDPEFWIGYIQLGQALEQQDDFEGALRAFADAHRHSGGNSKTIAMRGHTLARMGRREEALAALRELEEIAGARYLPPYALALVHMGLNDADPALAKLEDALAAGDVHLNFLTVDPKWDPLRGDPRFAALLERCGFGKGGN
jgi:tetratricopeptide (TPR) repeat protein